MYMGDTNFKNIILEVSRSLRTAYQNENYTSYIGAAYVKYVEMAGARVVPGLTIKSFLSALLLASTYFLFVRENRFFHSVWLFGVISFRFK